MSDEETQLLFAFQKYYMSKSSFSAGKPIYELGLIKDKSIEAARDHIVSRSSIASIKDGLTIEIIQVDFSSAEKFYAEYDGEFDIYEPGPSARLIVKKL